MINGAFVAAVIVLAAGSGGCASLKNEQAFGKSVTEADAALNTAATFAQKVQYEFQLTNDSRAFLAKTPSRSTASSPECSTDIAREVNIARNRIAKFKIVNAYFKKMETILGDNIDFAKYAAEFDAAAASINEVPIPGFSVAAELAVVKAVAGPAGRLANQAQAAWDLKRISEIARKIEGPLKKVIDDIQTGLVSSQEALNAAVKFWETCENERLEVIYAHPNVNPVEISALFENYQTKLASFKAQNKVVLNTKSTLDAVLVANKKLSDPKLKFEDAKIWIETGAKSMKDFKAIVDELDKL